MRPYQYHLYVQNESIERSSDVHAIYSQQELFVLVPAFLGLMRELDLPFKEHLMPFGDASSWHGL